MRAVQSLRSTKWLAKLGAAARAWGRLESAGHFRRRDAVGSQIFGHFTH